MKPKHNRVWCPDCGRPKMFFETESKANNFIKWNGEDIDTRGGELRPYYCPACCGYHISSKEHKMSYEHNTEKLISAFTRSVDAAKTRTLGIDETIKKYEKSKNALDIWNAMPNDIKDSGNKNAVKRFVTEWYQSKGIVEKDGGERRKKVYDMWMEHNFQINNKG